MADTPVPLPLNQLNDRGTVQGTDQIPNLPLNGTTLEKSTVSDLQTYMQANLSFMTAINGLTGDVTATGPGTVNATGSLSSKVKGAVAASAVAAMAVATGLRPPPTLFPL